ncbi:hypothetical protein SADUNF_Sadunf05G0069100 [Salix dunnii]|uniref:Uncharacterized protein n=1 Tax=Salix dunnii TaxID=1413687 RepID=A0A835K772_9ROSI|nr:hypothetical protein SADUNF_Sadunf05G0069100 [Salix dunnii]
MKQLIRRLSRVADSSQYSLLRSNSQSTSTASRRISGGSRSARRRGSAKPVPEGHVPVYVGDEMERFTVSAELLNHPVFIWLLNKSAQEYGYEQRGVLRIPCHVLVFERVMESLRLGLESRDLEDVLGSFFTSEDYLENLGFKGDYTLITISSASYQGLNLNLNGLFISGYSVTVWTRSQHRGDLILVAFTACGQD